MKLEGKIISNRYEMIEMIGKGGMATVYKAKDLTLKRFVAIKILREEFTTDEEFIRRFNIEAQAAASLAHQNIVSIYDVGSENNIYYIVMELIKGKTLKQIIDEDGVLPWKWSLNIAIQIASALEVAHKNNIVHRDIKPHNIIITEEGIAKVTDFGIAKAVSNSTITAFGTTIGSVHYFSPEHARGGYTDAKSDLYSLGVVMYEMLTGRVPFDADTPVSIALKHMQEEPVEPIKLNPSIPYSVNKIILKAMKKDANVRYGSASEMLKDLSLALKNPDGEFVTENRDTSSYTQVISTMPNQEIKKENEAKPETKKEEKKKGKLKTFFKEHPSMKILIIALIILLIPICVFFATKGVLNIGREKDINIPNFVNLTKEEAEAEAKKAKVELQIEEEFNKDVELGKVISQDPVYMDNYTIKENSTVKIVVSKGKNTKIVPKVVGEKYEDAEALLEEQELKVEKIEQTSDKVEAGVVIKQEPEQEKELEAGETVKVYVSTGAKQITMEYVIGEKEADAKTKLTKIGFKVEVIYEEDNSKEDGTVIKQSIETGSQVKDGSKVILTVNKIIKAKEGTVKIDLKSITGGVIEKDEEGNEIDPNASVTVKVDGNEIYSDTHRRDGSLTLSGSDGIKGKGKVTVEVLVTWENGSKSRQRSEQIDLSKDGQVLNIN